MDLIKRLALFADIVEKGSIAAAARHRVTTRSAASKQLAKLEQELDIRLLHRNTRSMSLTGPGRMLYEQAQRLRESHKQTEALIASIGGQVSGELCITSSFHLGHFLLTDVIGSFSNQYPLVIPNLQLSDTTTDIISDNIDLAIRIGNLQDSRLVGRKLCNNPVIMVASTEFLKSQGEPDGMKALENMPCITYESAEVRVDNWFYFEHGKEKVVKVQSAFKTNDGRLLLDACLGGYGIALLPTYVASNAVRSGKLKVVLPRIRLKDYQSIYLIYASRKHISPALSEFLTHIKWWVQQHPVPEKFGLTDD